MNSPDKTKTRKWFWGAQNVCPLAFINHIHSIWACNDVTGSFNFKQRTATKYHVDVYMFVVRSHLANDAIFLFCLYSLFSN